MVGRLLVLSSLSILAFTLPVRAAAETPAAAPIFVESSTLAVELRTLLTEELGPSVLAQHAEDAVLVASISRRPGALDLLVRAASGERVLERAIALDDAVRPALRVAVLLLRQARAAILAPSRSPPPGATEATRTSTLTARTSTPTLSAPPSATTVDPPNVWGLEADASFAVAPWASPFSPPSLGLGLGARARWGRLAFGAEVSFFGQLCCARSTSTLTGDVKETMFVLSIDVELLRTSLLRFGAFAAGGVTLLRGEARADIFGSPGTWSPIAAERGIALAGASLTFALDARWSVEVRAGARVFAGDATIEVPGLLISGSDRDPDPLETGVVTPFAALGAAFAIF